ncbi:MAG: hypothetical protein ACLFN8_01155 [Candidatus Woesearchaeota archaeon]
MNSRDIGNKIADILDSAKKLAFSGEVRAMDDSIGAAQNYANFIKKDISSDVSMLLYVGRFNGALLDLYVAKDLALKDNFGGALFCLDLAKRNAESSGRDILQGVALITNYINSSTKNEGFKRFCQEGYSEIVFDVNSQFKLTDKFDFKNIKKKPNAYLKVEQDEKTMYLN